MGILSLFENFSKEIPFVVSENEYNTFQNCSKDMNPLHVDECFARAKGFKERVMYGNILNAFISYAIGMELPMQNVILLTQSIQYKNPIYLNDELVMSLKTESITEAVNSVKLVYKFYDENKKVVAKGNIMIGVLV